MKKIQIILPFALIALFLMNACQSGNSGQKAKEPNRSELLESIQQQENQLFGEIKQNPDLEASKTLKDSYLSFAQSFPKDSLSPELMFRAADLSIYLKQYGEGISIYESILRKYPEYVRAPECMFLTAWVYDEHLRKFDLAKEKYEAFIKAYPESSFREAAEISIKHLGKSPEEIMQEILKKDK